MRGGVDATEGEMAEKVKQSSRRRDAFGVEQEAAAVVGFVGGVSDEYGLTVGRGGFGEEVLGDLLLPGGDLVVGR
jgi:hypothetical protein